MNRTTLRVSKAPINTLEFSKSCKLQREVGGSKKKKNTTKKEGKKEKPHPLGCLSPTFPDTLESIFIRSPLEAILQKLAKEQEEAKTFGLNLPGWISMASISTVMFED